MHSDIVSQSIEQIQLQLVPRSCQHHVDSQWRSWNILLSTRHPREVAVKRSEEL